MDRGNHYEAAFEAYLQWYRLGYVAVDETKRSQMEDMRVKSLDFIVYGAGGAKLLIDVKGRRFPTGAVGRQRRVWECWSTQDDVCGLERWVQTFGSDYRGLLVFVYQLLPEANFDSPEEDLWTWRGRRYLFRAVTVEDYRRHMRVRSPKWETVSLPGPVFRQLFRPFDQFVRPGVRTPIPAS